MKRLLLLLAIAGTFSLLSGCAVMDFLDGKHFSQDADYGGTRSSSGSYAGGHGGGHSH